MRLRHRSSRSAIRLMLTIGAGFSVGTVKSQAHDGTEQAAPGRPHPDRLAMRGVRDETSSSGDRELPAGADSGAAAGWGGARGLVRPATDGLRTGRGAGLGRAAGGGGGADRDLRLRDL